MSFPAIQDLLPHAHPMLWLDRVLYHEGDEVHCGLEIRDEHVFVEDGVVESIVSVEWMAQAVGALVGLLDHQQDIAPRPGYLIAIAEATFEVDLFHPGDSLVVEAKRVWGDSELASFECMVRREGVRVARAQLSVYRRTEPPGTPS